MFEEPKDFIDEINTINIYNNNYSNNNYNYYYIKQLNSVKEILFNIYNETKKLISLFQNFIIDSQKFKLQKEIDENIQYFIIKNFDDKCEECILFKQKDKFKQYYELTSNLYLNKYIKNIKDLNENLNNILYEITEYNFIPPSINSFANSSIDLFKSSKFYQDKLNTTEDKEESFLLFCTLCKNKQSICFCDDCNQIFCNECLNSYLEKEKNENKKHKHNLVYIEQIKAKNQLSKTYFLNSISNIIKSILTKANDLLNNEKNIQIISLNNSNNKSIEYIKKTIEYPYIKNINDLNCQIDFLVGINSFLKNDLNENNKDLNTSFHISKMNKELIDKLKNIFVDENFILFKGILSEIDNNFYSDDDVYTHEHFELNDEIKNQFYISINIMPIRNNIHFEDKNIREKIINLINSNLFIDKENIFFSFNDKFNFTDNYIRTKEFCDNSIEIIKKNFPNLNKLYEFKMIVNDLFCNLCDLKNFIDYRGNFVIPNKNLTTNRGTEKYDPPYGWIGIGLKVAGKYENDDWLNIRDESSKWAIAYHGVGRINSCEEIINMLKNIITEEGLKPGPSQIKCHLNDIRHPGKKIGTGVYLTPSINIAEEYSGIIPFNNKKYKIVLMTKVKIDKIKEPEDFNYWIVNKEYIRVYRILLKEKI